MASTGVSLYKTSPNEASEQYRPYLLEEMAKCNEQLIGILNEKSFNQSKLKKHYVSARKHYKHIEFIIEYISPKEAKYYINGPLVPKYDADMGSEVFYPQGFQKIEEIIYDGDVRQFQLLKGQVSDLKDQLSKLRDYYKDVELRDGQLLEMMQLQLFRLATMSFNGYDATISLDGIKESEWSLEGVNKAFTFFNIYAERDPLVLQPYQRSVSLFKSAHKHLVANTDFNSFDRLNFIVNYINPINENIVKLHNTAHLSWSGRKQALNLNSSTLFSRKNFNLQHFSIYYDDTLFNEKQAALGKLLFFDPRLSGGNNMSCATCHNPDKGFTDGRNLTVTTGLIKDNIRNTPSLLDVAFQKAFFFDGRAYQLEQQVFDVVHNKNEMHSTLDEAISKLNKSVEYRMLFDKAFEDKSGITAYNIQKAISEYEKTLVTFNSAFDKYIQGDLTSLSKEAVDGYNLFAGKALCGSCHFFPVFNGAVPPFYNDSEFEVLGVPASAGAKEIDPDKGRFNVTGVKEFMYAFKTPTVRNSALTAPYMHNGIYNTLEEVVDFYHKGGGAGLGIPIENQTLPFDSLDLNAYEKKAIVSFLESLTDTSGIGSRPQRLPEINEDIIREEIRY
ncbi:cytochrome-c peroxidase [Sporocytophaga myxococcoides]|uniref:cytochrome-c peroxidase n=1 Tax=Sporocytophaga myxococcoides TaxID=153721 RepID=UPI0004202E42|nr:cytochrome c peroxidase [Sporocytophaga myxococcoides]